MHGRRATAVVGAGWAGLAAAIEATRIGDAVTLFEMAPRPGGRARSVELGIGTLDNGQHIAIGAYRETLQLMSDVGLAERDAFVRMPLALLDADGNGLQLKGGRPMPAFVRAVLAHSRWPWSARVALLRVAAGWMWRGFDCDPSMTVTSLTSALPAVVRRELIEPLCIAALNTAAANASARVFLRVLHDALFEGAGSSDLLLPRQPLGALLPEPAARWLARRGAVLHLGTRVQSLATDGTGWRIGDTPFDRVILATSNTEAARLALPFAPAWSAMASALDHEAIVTVYLRSEGSRLPHPMLMLDSTPNEPAQFVFDRGRLGGPPGLLAFVVSGANDWIGRSVDVQAAVTAQAVGRLSTHLRGPLQPVHVITEKRATFACTPASKRPPRDIADQLIAAGDYVDGPYPATLEGAIRTGLAAARSELPRGRADRAPAD